MLFLYDMVLSVALLLACPYLLPKALLGGHGLKERLGLWPRDFFRQIESAPVLWLHAASVGEVHSLAAFLPALRRRAPQFKFILSVTTRAGRERAVHLGEEICRVFYLPIDLSFLVKRVLRRVNPKVLLLAETELWPNLILQARRRGTKVAMINGRMSAGSFSRYRIFPGLMTKILGSMEVLCLQSEEDARRFRALGADRLTVRVMGNIKGDLLATGQMRGERTLVRHDLGIPADTHVLVAGSTRSGEEGEIARAILALKADNGSFRAIMAPRHVKRSRRVMRLLQAKGLVVKRYSKLKRSSHDPWEVLLVDTLGHLMRLYAAADIAFVGGSLLPYGGHNPLEPASYGVPVVFGPYMENCHRSAHLLLQAGGAIQVTDGEQLKEMASRLFFSSEERHRRGQAALKVVRESGGTSERTAQVLKETVL